MSGELRFAPILALTCVATQIATEMAVLGAGYGDWACGMHSIGLYKVSAACTWN